MVQWCNNGLHMDLAETLRMGHLKSFLKMGRLCMQRWDRSSQNDSSMRLQGTRRCLRLNWHLLDIVIEFAC